SPRRPSCSSSFRFPRKAHGRSSGTTARGCTASTEREREEASMSMTTRLAWSLLLIVVLSAPVVAPADSGPHGTLTVAYATLFDENLNPLLGPAPSKVFYDVMYEYLVYNDPQTLKAEPGLAERWSMSPDGKRWTFFLRKGVTFSDGTEFTAEDVKFSLELMERKDSRWPFRSTSLRIEPKVLDRHTIAFDAKEGGIADLDQSF